MNPTNTPAPTDQPVNQPAPTQPSPATAGDDTYVIALTNFGLFAHGSIANRITDKPVALALFASGKIHVFNGKGEVVEELNAKNITLEENKGIIRVNGVKLTVNGEPRIFVDDSLSRSAKEAREILSGLHPEYQFSVGCETGILFFNIVEGYNKEPSQTISAFKKMTPEDLAPEKTTPEAIYKETGFDTTMFGLLFSPEKKSRSIILAVIGVPLLLLIALMINTTQKDISDLSDAKAYELEVKSTRVDSGFRESTELLTYTTVPPEIICENVVVATPLTVYPDEASRPKPGDTLRVYIKDDAQCTSNGLYITGYTEKTGTENALDSVTGVMLVGGFIFGAVVLLFGAFYSANKGVREFYLSHSYIGKGIGILFFGWIAISYAMRFYDLSALGIGGLLVPLVFIVLFIIFARRKR